MLNEKNGGVHVLDEGFCLSWVGAGTQRRVECARNKVDMDLDAQLGGQAGSDAAGVPTHSKGGKLTGAPPLILPHPSPAFSPVPLA